MVAMSKRWLVGWVLFSVLWTFAFLCATFVGAMACDGDGGEPYAAPASPLGRYCAAADAVYGGNIFLFWTLGPVLVLAVGIVALAFGRRRVVVAVGIAVAALIVVHAGLSLGLPSTCSPDDETVAGCSHY
jgi:hypothetical protein